MKLFHSAMVLASLAAASAVVGAACSFPTIHFRGESSSAGSGGGATEASSSSAGGDGGATEASSSSAGGGGASSSASSSSGAPPCSIDEDQDGALSKQCLGGTDCADNDLLAHPEPPPADFQTGPIQGAKAPGTQPFDFNCDGSETGETPVLNCFGLIPCKSDPGFKSAVTCGQTGALGHCAIVFLLGCQFEAENPTQNKVQRCK